MAAQLVKPWQPGCLSPQAVVTGPNISSVSSPLLLAWNPLIDAVASRSSALWDLQLPPKDRLIHFGFVAFHSFVTLLTTSRRLVMLFVVTIRFDHLLFFC